MKFCKDCKSRKNRYCPAKSEFVPRKQRKDGKIVAEDCDKFSKK